MPSNRLKSSIYNLWLEEAEGSFLLANTLSGAVLRLSDKDSLIVKAVLQEPERAIGLDQASLETLVSNGFLIDSSFDEREWVKSLHFKAREGIRALGIGIALTLKCNFRCTYCYQDHQKIDMPETVQRSILEYAKRNIDEKYVIKVVWTGGEPLLCMRAIERLSTELISLSQKAKVDYSASLATNGYLLSKAVAARLKNAHIDDVQITLDGPASSHDERRILADGRGTFKRIMENVIDASGVFERVVLRVNIDLRNKDRIPELIDQIPQGKHNLVLAFRATTSPESPDVKASWCMNPREYWQYEDSLIQYAKDRGLGVLIGYTVPGTSFCAGYQKHTITVDPYGDVHRCPVCIGRRHQRYGELLSDGSINVIGGFQADWDNWNPFLDSECEECVALPLCMGGCLWYLRTEKSSSMRCAAKHSIVARVSSDALLNGWIRAV